MTKTILFGILVIVIILISGCVETPTGNVVKETVTQFVCPDGSVVSNKEDCPKIEEKNVKQECVEEKIGEDFCLTDDKVGYEQRQCPSGDIIKIVKETCSNGCINGNCSKPLISQKETTDELDKSITDLNKAFEDLGKELEKSSKISSKIDECTKICAGDQINIPYVKNEFYMACYQIYYYAGESALDKYVAECNN